MSRQVNCGLASRARAKTPAASGAAAKKWFLTNVNEEFRGNIAIILKVILKVCFVAKQPSSVTLSKLLPDVPLWLRVQRPYKSVVATPVSGLRPPLEKVEANVEEQD